MKNFVPIFFFFSIEKSKKLDSQSLEGNTTGRVEKALKEDFLVLSKGRLYQMEESLGDRIHNFEGCWVGIEYPVTAASGNLGAWPL